MKYKYLLTSVLISVCSVHLNAQNNKCVVYVDKPGTLKNEVIKEKSLADNITDLIVTGYINAKDFRFMRDSMPSLRNLDISNVGLKPYAGKDGTLSQFAITVMKEIPAYAFCNNNTGRFIGKQSLRTIVMPSELINIGKYAFKNCNNLKVVIMKSNYGPGLETGALNDTISAVYVPAGSREHYRSHNSWSGFSILEGDPVSVTVNLQKGGELGNELLKIGHQPSEVNYLTVSGQMNDEDFKLIRDFMQNLVIVHIKNTNAISIPEYTFSQKKNLMHIDLPSGLLRIGERAFSGCINLGSTLYLPSSIADIDDGAFLDCDKLIHVIAKCSRVNIIGKDIFRNSWQRIEYSK